MSAPPIITLPPPELSGYLSEDESSAVFAADLYIAAMGRSGSTLMCDLLTVPHSSICMMEPWFIEGCRSRTVLAQLRSVGLAITEKEWWDGLAERRHDKYVSRYQHMLSPRLRSLDRWGAKEVRPEFHRPTIATLNPRRLLVLVRDVRDAALSLYAMRITKGDDDTAAWFWTSTYIVLAANELTSLVRNPPADQDPLISRYEDFSKSHAVREALSIQLEWGMEGEPNACFETIGRAAEAERFGGKIKQGFVRHQVERDKRMLSRIYELSSACTEYQQLFGYL